MASQKVFSGTPAAAATLHPFITTGPLSGQGAFLGVELRHRGIVTIDPWLMKTLRILHSMVFLILGQKDHGKSTLIKVLLARLATLQPGSALETLIRIHDRKREGDFPEYGKLTEALMCDIIALRQARLNLLDPAMRMSVWDTINALVELIEEQNHTKLVGFQRLSLQIAVKQMMTEEQMTAEASLKLLALNTRRLNFGDIDRYYDALARDLGQAVLLDGSRYSRQDLADRPDDRRAAEQFRVDSETLSGYIAWLFDGAIGGVLGHSGSLRSQLSQSAVTFDWSGVNNNAATVIETWLMHWMMTALVNNDLGIIPHLEVREEEHTALANLAHSRAQSNLIRIARAFHTCMLLVTQFITDFTDAGSADSELRGLSMGMLNGMGAYILGRQPNNDDIKHLLTTVLKLSDQDAELTTQLGMGWFWLVVPNQAPILFQLILDEEVELPLVLTGSATENMVARKLALSADDIEDIAMRYGVRPAHKLGEEDYVAGEAARLYAATGNGQVNH